MRIVATGGTMSISSNGQYEQHVAHDVFIDGSSNGTLTHVDRGVCARGGAQLQCESNYLEGVAFTAVGSGRTLTISQDLTGEGHAATYRYAWVGATQ